MSSAKLNPVDILVGATVGIPTALVVYLRLKYPNLLKDLKAIQAARQKSKIISKLVASNITIVDIFEKHVQHNPNKPLILYEDATYTYQDVDKEANRLARFVQHGGRLHFQDTVAFFLHNEPAFIWSWLGFNKLGIATAFINTDLRLRGLLHCIQICGAKIIVCGKEPDLVDALLEILPDLKSIGVQVWGLGGNILSADNAVCHLDTSHYSSEPLTTDVRDGMTMDDIAIYIFTSGTTGLPKACNVPHQRLLFQSFLQWPFDVSEKDVLYTPMPLYHTAAFGLGFLNMLRVGGTTALGFKFSASRYWDDVRKYKATIVQYIGEMCRYLLAQPRNDNDGHYPRRIRYAIGNGLRPDIWQAFQQRFNIGHIAEIFGATESNFFLMNMDGKVGSVGQYSGLYKVWHNNYEIIQCDQETGEPIRGKDGLCIPVNSGEHGLFVSKIAKDTPFYGYRASKSTNEKKIARNVKILGDEYFNIGDLVTFDEEGHVYFYDRIGDTFRWKGQNVSTTEVEEIIDAFPGVLDSIVYGVTVPGNEGKAGMAAIVFQYDPTSNFDSVLRGFSSYTVKHLPLYACPMFLRMMSALPVTGTFKHEKTRLSIEGFDINIVHDPLYVMDIKRKHYVPLREEKLKKILIGNAKL